MGLGDGSRSNYYDGSGEDDFLYHDAMATSTIYDLADTHFDVSVARVWTNSYQIKLR